MEEVDHRPPFDGDLERLDRMAQLRRSMSGDEQLHITLLTTQSLGPYI